jgi:hypothetical protein
LFFQAWMKVVGNNAAQGRLETTIIGR